nr:immunoglobulin light chain junction region [Macaca mulatta]MPN90874.1 immunoglobulin light chain junction region [Macaca mulatta]MPN90878.1 immunoglobulin light chain junction region [Macaca mulatta]MPN90889.1 immunoglobulin light chain junction region [Macaca mulatta]MPN90950.1 immunoglobulin light chain junction region [Macaca mulatta]
CQQCNSLPYSF